MQVNLEVKDGKATLVLSGRFDFNSHREFRNGCDEVMNSSQINEVEINLAGVDYLDSSALGMLLLLRERAVASNKKLALVECQGTVKQVLDVANFSQLFTIK